MKPPVKYWQSLEPHVPAAGEFSAPAPVWDDDLSRRGFLKLVGASAALAGLTACTREPMQAIVPYVRQPEELIPGRPLHYATAMPFQGFGVGLLVRSHEGHPTKIEGNPSHPASNGATGIFQQAALLDLYDPDRAQIVTEAGRPCTLASFQSALNGVMQKLQRGAGLRILTQSVTSPTFVAQLEELLLKFPEARWHQYQPLPRDNTLEGARLAFGKPVETRFHFEKAKTILSLDSDFLFDHPASLLHTRQLAEARRVESCRLYVVEPTPSITGSMADHRLPAAANEIQVLAFALARELGVTIEGPAQEFSEKNRRWIQIVAQELRQNSGQGLIVVGENQPSSVHALVHALNAHLGNVGRTLEYASSAEPHWINHRESMAQFGDELKHGLVECLIMVGGNPVFDSPADFNFGANLAKAKFTIHLSTERNETSEACQWHIPESHFLESWSDVRAFDGTVSIVQPLVMPLYSSKTAHEFFHYLLHEETKSDYEVVRDHWRTQKTEGDFEEWWRLTLHEGWMAGSKLPALSVTLNTDFAPKVIKEQITGLELCFRPDPTAWDGSFAGNAWLQELPKPFSKVTWDNPALISPALAQRLQLVSGDMVKLKGQGNELTLPVWIMPGQAENSVMLHLGLGRTHAGRTGKDIGFNGYTLRQAKTFWAATGVELIKTGKHHLLATTQQHHNVEGRSILKKNPHEPEPACTETLYHPDEFKNKEHAWGMAIDLNACIGCNACVLACQAENNIPVVGKEQVAAGRDMAWIRIDHYFEGAAENPRIHPQPVPCMHCENAPCEIVCPVGATVHDHEGLNLQVYNRCVGTRYCSNNCPYKVRRFNFFRYADYETPSLKPMRNPNVTVRWRGVMEKCTYCIQRISEVRIASELNGRPIKDGEIKTACQQVCPAQAIVFGDINDPANAVAKQKSSPRNFSMLSELNARPRTTYLERRHNPNPALEGIA